MCGIVGYISSKPNSDSLSMGIQALKRLEYRGYDSSGLVFLENGEVFSKKAVGRISKLEEKIKGRRQKANPLLLHTRWATTGKVSLENAHPHCGCKKNIWLVHNGIIENYQSLKKKLIEKGHVFTSETDTEVIAHLIEEFFEGNLEKAVKKSLPYLKGTYGLAVISKEDPNKIVAARMSSPLLIGVGENEYMIASDPTAVISRTKKVIYLEDGETALITPKRLTITEGSQIKEKEPKKIEWDFEDTQKGKYEHFMLKEIMEQPESLKSAITGRIKEEVLLGGLINVEEKLKNIKRIVITACGTAFYAGTIGQYLIENISGIPCSVFTASELKYKNPIFEKDTALIAISQSGETADTLGAIKEAKRKGALTIGIVNAVGSSVARETDAGIYNHAGPEIGVASTKAFTSQLTILCLLSIFLGRQRNLTKEASDRISKEILKIPDLASQILNRHPEIREIALKYKKYNNFLYLGRKYNYPIALEGALKLKEISYIHAEGYPSGEMKHGPIALIDENFPTFAIAVSDSVYDKMISSIEEIKVRKGPIIAIATKGNEEIKNKVDDVFYIPETLEILNPILSVVPLQLFAYYVAQLKGKDIDKPRNLAKSVTVE